MSDLIKKESNSWINPASFDDAMSLANALAGSKIVPADYQGKPENCLIAMMEAQSLGISPLTVMQNLYIIKGKPGWDSKFIIQSINGSGVLDGRLKFKRTKLVKIDVPGGPKGFQAYSYQAYGKEADSGEIIEGPEVTTMTMIANNWHRNALWLSDHQNMLMLRAAKRFANMYGLGPGGLSDNEVRDVAATGILTESDDLNERISVPPKKMDSSPNEGIVEDVTEFSEIDAPEIENVQKDDESVKNADPELF